MKAPGILQIIGGLIVLLGGIALIALGSFVGAATGLDLIGLTVGAMGGVHIILGIVIILAGLMHEKNPAWSWVGLVFSLLALISGGGVIVGPFIANVGAAMSMKSRAKGK